MICTRWLALSTRQSSNSLSTCDWVSSLGTTERKTIFALRSNTTISVISFRFNGCWAIDESRTRDLLLGKQALYLLSYYRMTRATVIIRNKCFRI